MARKKAMREMKVGWAFHMSLALSLLDAKKNLQRAVAAEDEGQVQKMRVKCDVAKISAKRKMRAMQNTMARRKAVLKKDHNIDLSRLAEAQMQIRPRWFQELQ